MTVEELLAEVAAVLQREGHVSYRILKRRFKLDDEYLEDVKWGLEADSPSPEWFS